MVDPLAQGLDDLMEATKPSRFMPDPLVVSIDSLGAALGRPSIACRFGRGLAFEQGTNAVKPFAKTASRVDQMRGYCTPFRSRNAG